MSRVRHFVVLYRPSAPARPWAVDELRRKLAGLTGDWPGS